MASTLDVLDRGIPTREWERAPNRHVGQGFRRLRGLVYAKMSLAKDELLTLCCLPLRDTTLALDFETAYTALWNTAVSPLQVTWKAACFG